MSRYKPEFRKGEDGNVLDHGKDLVINVSGNPLYVIGQLYRGHFFLTRKLIQIEQTGSRQNPQKDNIVFEMKERTNGIIQPMTKGKYRVVIYAYFVGLGGKRWRDNFEIV